MNVVVSLQLQPMSLIAQTVGLGTRTYDMLTLVQMHHPIPTERRRGAGVVGRYRWQMGMGKP